MWSKTLLGVMLFLTPMIALSETDWHPETVTYQVKEATRFYRWSSYDKKKHQQVYVSFVVPKGLTLAGCGSVGDDFLGGMECGQAEDPTITGTLEKDGKKRRVEITLGGGRVDLEKRPELKETAGQQKAVQGILGRPYGYEENLENGEFKTAGGVGHFVRKKRSSSDGNHDFFKVVSKIRIPCGLNGFYREMEGDSTDGKYIEPQNWLFEGVFDEIMRGMKCEEVPWDYVEKWNKDQEAKSKAKSAPVKKKPKKK